MARYVSRSPRAAHIDDPEMGMAATADHIFAAEDDFIDTGLLDANGARLYRCRERVRLGFTEE